MLMSKGSLVGSMDLVIRVTHETWNSPELQMYGKLFLGRPNQIPVVHFVKVLLSTAECAIDDPLLQRSPKATGK